MAAATTNEPAEDAENQRAGDVTVPLPERFKCLADMQAEHVAMLRRARTLSPSERRLQVLTFIDAGRRTGVVLDTYEDRCAAQDMLDYWGSSLYATEGESSTSAILNPLEPINAALEPFNAPVVEDIAGNTEAVFFLMKTSADQEIVRRVMISLFRLPPGETRSQPTSMLRTELESMSSDRAAVQNAIKALVTAGALRLVPSATGGEVISVVHESLSRKWPRLGEWLARRAEFRKAASFWKSSGEDRAALIRGRLLLEARRYPDLDEVERLFIDASSIGEVRMTRVYRVVAIAGISLAIAAGVGWYWAKVNEKSAIREQSAADQSRQELQTANNSLVRMRKATAEKHKLRNVALLTHTLAEVATAPTQQHLRVARIKWDALKTTLTAEQSSEKSATTRDSGYSAFFKAGDAAIKALGDDSVPFSSVGAVNTVASIALDMGYSYRDNATALDDPDVNEALASLRAITFETTKSYAGAIVRTFDQGAFQDAEPLIREFRVLYWGDMGLVEGSKVAMAMKNFETKLRQIHVKMTTPTPEQDRLIAELQKSLANGGNLRDPKYGPLWLQLKELGTDLDISSGSIYKQLSTSVSKRRVDSADVAELRETLFKALENAMLEERSQPWKARVEHLPSAR